MQVCKTILLRTYLSSLLYYLLGMYDIRDDDIDEPPEEVLTNSTEQIYTYSSGKCYKIWINYDISKKDIARSLITITLSFNESISFDDLPDLDFYITSEKNSNGIIFNEWIDGNEYKLSFEKVSITQSKTLFKIISNHP